MRSRRAEVIPPVTLENVDLNSSESRGQVRLIVYTLVRVSLINCGKRHPSSLCLTIDEATAAAVYLWSARNNFFATSQNIMVDQTKDTNMKNLTNHSFSVDPPISGSPGSLRI
ncbi:hypothetical protein ElyMa_001934700 [Elysia marginata]|uniref:Uncharacterized protein n=1 Tax=Elysia marginata TaxID=1093978 RepID=A0AAV4EWJ3_9GAST|nr:hypothetical protein ElyMa_001934700 [Elysia marginata]